ncbi:MFS transporter [Maledivibacter halophilus]|uniref:Sugar phosphate permease n=1 Tax=Maledivibacter halophilus TaxID=36842 RepID=A0A1T5MDP5_9FIRM|nr:MFS transporter [Maledivibacter halophilus]SKC86356.1 Sugar phosphate permease [Maledivibacter halophilus]
MYSLNMINSSEKAKKMMKYRWLIWGVIVLAYAIKFFHSLSMGVVKDTIIAEFALTETTFVSIGNSFFYIYLIMQIPTGLLVDTLGARKTASYGTLIAAFGIILFSFSHSVALLYVGRGMVGLGTSVVFVSILKIQSEWFKESEFGTMTGITCFIGVLGGALAQTPLALMVSNIGWRNSFRGIGIVSMVVAAAIYFIVRNTPKELGMPSVKELEGKLNEDKSESNEDNISIMTGLLQVLKNPKTWPVFFMYAGFYGTYVIMMGYWGTSFISSVYGKSTIQSSNYITAGVLGSAIGSMVIGNISDKIRSRKKPLLISGGLYVFTWVFIVFAKGGQPPSFLLLPLIFMVGFMSCAYVISWPCIKEVNHPKYVGVSTSVANIGGFFGTIVLPPIVAKVFDKYSLTLSPAALYQKAFTVVLIAAVIGFISSLFVKETGCKNIYRKF